MDKALDLDRFHHVIVGNSHDETLKHQRIIHITDTHMEHETFLKDGLVPEGDILVHSGDFSKQLISRHQDLKTYMEPVEKFFSQLPHRYKIFLSGNHDYSLENHSCEEVQDLLSSAIYLQDKSVTLEGIKFYGTGWTRLRESSQARAFAVSEEDLIKYWDKIPQDIDVLVSHSPPYGILDQDVVGTIPEVTGCVPEVTCSHGHLGSMEFYKAVLQRIR